MLSWPSLVFAVSSIITLALIYFHAPIPLLQQITAALLVILLISAGRLTSRPANTGSKKVLYLFSLGISSFFVQVLILATGGIYSSFLILVHLYTLGSSFLLDISSSIIFLVFTLIILVFNISLTPQILTIFRDDPGTAILYFISFIIVIPLAQYLMYSYHLKDNLLRALKEYAETGEQREKSILNNIKEMVVVTDQSLKILSANDTVEQSLGLIPDTYLNHPMLDFIPLKDSNNNPLTAKELSIDQILDDKVIRIINGFFFQAPSDPKPKSVAIQIRPVTNSKNEISQIVFLITDPQKQKGLQKHSDLEEALTKHKLLAEQLKTTLTKAGLNDTLSKFELFNKTETDLTLAYELEDHPINNNPTPEDLAALGKQIVASKQNLAQALGVKLEFTLSSQENDEANLLLLLDKGITPQALPLSPFTVPVDKHWFIIAIQKILDLSLLLASSKPRQQVELSVKHNEQNSQLVSLLVTIPYYSISNQEIQKLFVQYYSGLTNKSNLHLGSGLEGFIAKSILDQLNIFINTKFDQNTSSLVFSFDIIKTLPY